MHPDEDLRYLEDRILRLARTIEILQWRLRVALQLPDLLGRDASSPSPEGATRPGVPILVEGEGDDHATASSTPARDPPEEGATGTREQRDRDRESYRAYV